MLDSPKWMGTVLDQLTNDKNLSKLIVGKEIEKSFFVKNRLINILLK